MLNDIPEKEWNVLNHKIILLFVVFECGDQIFIKIPKFWLEQNFKIAHMDKKLPKNMFQMIQNLFKVISDNTVIIFDHSDHVKAKVDRDEPVQVIRMGIWNINE